jgi:hypothetical protein
MTFLVALALPMVFAVLKQGNGYPEVEGICSVAEEGFAKR